MLIHGLLVDGTLWRDVVPGLDGVRVVVPDLPLGAHRTPMRPDADLSLPGLAALIAGFLAALDLRDVVLVSNDTGTALTQLVLTRHPERVAGAVLTNGDCHENFLPPIFRPLQWLGHAPALLALVTRLLGTRAGRGVSRTFGGLTSRPIDADRLRAWLPSGGSGVGVRRDLAAVLRGIDHRHTVEAAGELAGFPGRVQLVWGERDPYFNPAHARRLARDIGGPDPVWVPGSRCFVPIDAPDRLSGLVMDFVRSVTASR